MTNIDKWRHLIADRETSGLTVKEWCVRNSISKDSYYYWFKKVRNADSGKSDGQILFAEIQKETPVSSHPLIHGNLRVSWNGLEMQISDSNDARLAAELFGHLRTLC